MFVLVVTVTTCLWCGDMLTAGIAPWLGDCPARCVSRVHAPKHPDFDTDTQNYLSLVADLHKPVGVTNFNLHYRLDAWISANFRPEYKLATDSDYTIYTWIFRRLKHEELWLRKMYRVVSMVRTVLLYPQLPTLFQMRLVASRQNALREYAIHLSCTSKVL